MGERATTDDSINEEFNTTEDNAREKWKEKATRGTILLFAILTYGGVVPFLSLSFLTNDQSPKFPTITNHLKPAISGAGREARRRAV